MPREVAQRREVLHLLARAGVAVDDHVLADDLAALDLRADLGKRERTEVEAVLLDQPALLGVVDRAARHLGQVEGTPEGAPPAGLAGLLLLLRGLRLRGRGRRLLGLRRRLLGSLGLLRLRFRARVGLRPGRVRLSFRRVGLRLALRRERRRRAVLRGAPRRGGGRRADRGDAAGDAGLQIRQRLAQLHGGVETRAWIARQRLRDQAVDSGRRVGAVACDAQRRGRQLAREDL